MDVALAASLAGHYNAWHLGERVTRSFAHASCALRRISRTRPAHTISATARCASTSTPWSDYWSLSLYANNSDNFFVLDDREARNGADVLAHPRGRNSAGSRNGDVVESPSERGIALIRRLAPTPDTYAAARAGFAHRCVRARSALDLCQSQRRQPREQQRHCLAPRADQRP